MIQIVLLSTFILTLNSSSALSLTIAYTVCNFMMVHFAGVSVLSPLVGPLLLIKSLLVYILFRILEEQQSLALWVLIYFIGIPLIYLSDRLLGLPLIPFYSSIPWVEPMFSVSYPQNPNFAQMLQKYFHLQA